MRRMASWLKTVLTTAAVLLAEAGAAHAEEKAPPGSEGESLAQSWCADCHDVTGVDSEFLGITKYGDPPSFYAVANHLAVTELSLRAFLRTPHSEMPDIILEEKQAAAIIGYILSLRR